MLSALQGPANALNPGGVVCFATSLSLDRTPCGAQQFWAAEGDPWEFVPVAAFAEAFRASPAGQAAAAQLSTPFDTSSSHPDALVQKKHALSGMHTSSLADSKSQICAKLRPVSLRDMFACRDQQPLVIVDVRT